MATKQSNRPRVVVRCKADKITVKSIERIIEFFDPVLQIGGRIQFLRTLDGKLRVSLFHLDEGVLVDAGRRTFPRKR